MNVRFLFMLMLLFSSCAKQDPVATSVFNYQEIPSTYIKQSDSSLQYINNEVYVNGKKYSGFVYLLNSNNQDTLLLEGYFEGKQEGVQKKWYLNKQIFEIRFYKEGWKHGPQVSFFENGQKRFEFVAVKDAYEGELKEWNRNGQLIHFGTYVQGQEEGKQQLWYDNGKIRANYVIKNGKRYGLLGTKNCKNVSDTVLRSLQY